MRTTVDVKMDAIDEDTEVTFTTNARPVSTLRRSWPQTLQEVEHRYGVVLRGKAQGSDGDVHEPLKNSHGMYSWNKVYREKRRTTGGKRQVLCWKQLPDNQDVPLERSCIWLGGSGLFDIENNLDELAKIASLFDVVESDKRRSVRSGKESVLGSKRSTTLSMAMRRMRINVTKLGKLCWAFRDLDEKFLSPSTVDLFIKSSLWPSAGELEILKDRIRRRQELADPDSLLWFLAIAVPDASSRIKALHFRYEFDDMFEGMIRATTLIKSASLEVCTSELLKRLMRVVLLVGNRINVAFGGMQARGVTVQSLSKLSTIKTSDKSMSVLDCVVEYLDKVCPEAFGVTEDCTCVVEAAKYSLKAQTKALRHARRKLAFLKRYDAMSDFYFKAHRKLDDVERDIRLARISFSKCLEFFCVSPGSPMDTDEFFGFLSDFFQCLDVAIGAHEVRERLTFVRNKNENANDRLGSSSSLVSISSKRSIGSARLSIFGRVGSSSTADSTPKKYASLTAGRKSVFGRMKPMKE